MLIFDYAKYSHLGVIDAMDKELPYSYGKKDDERFEALKNTGFTFCMGLALCIGIGVFVASFFMNFSKDTLFVNGIRIVAFMIVLQLINALYIVLNRSRNNFSVISKYIILIALLDITVKIALVLKFKFYGLLWASVITWALGLWYFYKASIGRFKLLFNFKRADISRLFKVGFPIFIMGFVYMTLRNIDRIMIIRFMSRESLGFYTIAIMVSVYVTQLPNLIYAVIFPRFYQAYGEKQNIHQIRELFVRPTIVFAYFFAILIGLVIIGLPLLVQSLLPKYVDGVLPASILLSGAFFLALVNMSGYLLIALNKQIYMVLIGAVGIFAGAILNIIAIQKLGLGLAGVAVATSISHFFYATVLITVAFSNYTKKISEHLRFFLQLYAPFVWVAVLMFVLRGFTFNSSGDMWCDLRGVILKAIVFILACLPLVYYANKKTSVLRLAKEAYMQRHDKV